ncbi:MAG: hypothetical protein OCD01_12450 [Fibrobacterales bacterium]
MKILLLLICFTGLIYSHELEMSDSTVVEPVIEISFGSSLLYLEQDILTDGVVDSERLPVASVVFLAEWLFAKNWSLPLAINIPTEPSRLFKDSVMTEAHVASTVGAGVTWVPFQFKPFARAQLNLQIGALIFMDINPRDERAFYLLPLSRIHIETPSGFTLYFGGTYIPTHPIFAITYGVGQRF